MSFLWGVLITQLNISATFFFIVSNTSFSILVVHGPFLLYTSTSITFGIRAVPHTIISVLKHDSANRYRTWVIRRMCCMVFINFPHLTSSLHSPPRLSLPHLSSVIPSPPLICPHLFHSLDPALVPSFPLAQQLCGEIDSAAVVQETADTCEMPTLFNHTLCVCV